MAVQNLPSPGDPFQFVIFAQAVCPHLSEYSLDGPALEISMRRAPRVIFSGKHLPLTAGTQNIENPIQDLAWFGRRPSTRPFSWLGFGNVSLDFLPELIANVSPTWPSRKRPSILLPSQSGSPPMRRTLSRNLQNV